MNGARNLLCLSFISFYQLSSNQFSDDLLDLDSTADHHHGAVFFCTCSLVVQFGNSLGNFPDRKMKRLLTEHFLCPKCTQWNLFMKVCEISSWIGLLQKILLVLMSNFKISCSTQYDLDIASIMAVKWNMLK